VDKAVVLLLMRSIDQYRRWVDAMQLVRGCIHIHRMTLIYQHSSLGTASLQGFIFLCQFKNLDFETYLE